MWTVLSDWRCSFQQCQHILSVIWAVWNPGKMAFDEHSTLLGFKYMISAYNMDSCQYTEYFCLKTIPTAADHVFCCPSCKTSNRPNSLVRSIPKQCYYLILNHLAYGIIFWSLMQHGQLIIQQSWNFVHRSIYKTQHTLRLANLFNCHLLHPEHFVRVLLQKRSIYFLLWSKQCLTPHNNQTLSHHHSINLYA